MTPIYDVLESDGVVCVSTYELIQRLHTVVFKVAKIAKKSY